MCRLFGFRSVIQSQVHRSLVAAENALSTQSVKHRHGWGVAYYLMDTPHVIKSTSPAGEDQIFQRVSGIVASQTVLAHLRLASVGGVNILNTHPFQFGPWVFAHNGEIRRFDEVRAALRAEVAPAMRRYILGDTDSEVLFYLFLTYLGKYTDLHRRGTTVEAVTNALAETIQTVQRLADDSDATSDEERNKLSFIVTDGHSMVGVRYRKPLLFSTYKRRCFDREECPYLSPECEAPTESGFVNHLVITSEELHGDNIWLELDDCEVVGVDWRMRLYRGSLQDGISNVKPVAPEEPALR